jgi:hypothetical protein
LYRTSSRTQSTSSVRYGPYGVNAHLEQYSGNSCANSACPLADATWAGVLPSSSSTSTSAQCDNKVRATSCFNDNSRYDDETRCNEIRRLLSRALGSVHVPVIIVQAEDNRLWYERTKKPLQWGPTPAILKINICAMRKHCSDHFEVDKYCCMSQ